MNGTLLPVIFLFTFFRAFAQPYDPEAFPPLDPKVRSGILKNGMQYYIIANNYPENRAEFFLANKTGAIDEEDDQNGLAHFTEHMAFNGTAHFPGKSMLDYLATIGVKFGTNVNAGTGVEQTVYNLSDVPIVRESIIDSALLVLFDWAHLVSFESQEIEKERGVILEEWRMYGSAGERLNNKLAPVIYKGSKYARRDVIGDTAVLRNFPHARIRDFYKKWYRPDFQAVIVTGDFHPDSMERKVVQLFSRIPSRSEPSMKETHLVPGNQEVLIGIATDKEATGTNVELIYKHPAIPEHARNHAYMRTLLVRSLINQMFGQRMNELGMRENPPFISAGSYYGSFVKTGDAFTVSAQARNNEALGSLRALLVETERVRKHGFTFSELERAKANLLRNYESRYLERNKRKNRELLRPLLGRFLNSQPAPGIEYEYAFANHMVPGISLEEINRTAMGYITDTNMIITVTGPDKEGIIIPEEKAIRELLAASRTEDILPYEDQLQGSSLMETGPEPGRVTSITKNELMSSTEWTLENGMRVIIRQTDFREDEILVKAFSAGGMSLLADEDVTAAGLLSRAMADMGLGDHSKSALVKLLSGKKAGIGPGIGPDEEVLAGSASPKDLETALQLMHLYFTKPRWDAKDFGIWKEKQRARLVNASSNPRKAFGDTISVVMSNRSPRVLPLTAEVLDGVDMERMKRIYGERFGNPADFTVLLTGNVDLETTRPLVERYLGSLPAGQKREKPGDDGIRPPKGKVSADFTRENETPRTSVMICYHGSTTDSRENRMLAAAIRHCLELRYTESIREDEGGTYSVRVSMNIQKFPEPAYKLTVMFDTDPVKADRLAGIVHREVSLMQEQGPREDDLLKAKEYFMKKRQEDLKENNWWDNMLTDYYFSGTDMINAYGELVEGLEPSVIREYAHSLFSQGNVTEVIMRP